MKKIITLCLAFAATPSFAQSYAPPAGQVGTTAIHKDSSVFVGWATGIEVKRGFVNAADTTVIDGGSNRASFGVPENALYQAEGISVNVVSLGDGGSATLTFGQAIIDGPGPDFAVFENGVIETFLELAFVEVSSDGSHFVRFPAHSETPYITQIGGFGEVDCRYIHNLAGKYKSSFGTPFDLADLPVDPLLDIQNITHVRIIDVVGSIDTLIGTKDSYGNPINDLFPTPFASGGFDLDGIGVINQKTLNIFENQLNARLYPNPTNSILNIELNAISQIEIYDISGKLWIQETDVLNTSLDLSALNSGVYLVRIVSENQILNRKILLNK